MDTLYARSEDIFAKSLMSNIALDRPVKALSEVTNFVLTSDIPVYLRPHVLIRALRILRAIEAEKNILDICFARLVPHPTCGEFIMTLGEIWELPREHEWLCGECGRPLYDLRADRSSEVSETDCTK